MFDLNDLYQEVVVDHNRSPRNFHAMPDASCKADGFNPLCGDKLTLYLRLNDEGVIEDISFEGSGCAISVASASLMTEQLKGKTEAEAEALFERFHEMVTSDVSEPAPENLGKLAVLSGVREFPSRIKCASLCWHTMKSALEGDQAPVKTE
ncbi:MAG TPA: SUF system NifU family Fe-S cluster assembly protein [Mariprofundaceae bacterium]|nr:SUF system NifU family Fe-S cluster assembly protein [Mariprofundaceae bacterium]